MVIDEFEDEDLISEQVINQNFLIHRISKTESFKFFEISEEEEIKI